MGSSKQQRRADKKRRAHQDRAKENRAAHNPINHDSANRDSADHGPIPVAAAAVEQLVLAAARYGANGTGNGNWFISTRHVLDLVDIENFAPAPVRPSSIIDGILHRFVTSLYEHGWQPTDISHVVRGKCTVRAGRLMSALIASEARGTDAAHRAPQAWLDQLEDLGLYDATRSAIVGGHDSAMLGWVRAEQLDTDETLSISLLMLGQLLLLPWQPLLVDPPSAWGSTNRGLNTGAPAAAPVDVDAKALKTIRALLAKAEATTFDAEAEAFTAKAQELMTRHSIDAAVLAAAARESGRGGPAAGVESRRFHIESPYADEKAVLLSIIADVNGARSIWSPQVGFATVTGFAVDLHLTDVLFTSLLVQATRASADATAADRSLRTASFRRAFLVSYAHRIGERLELTRQHAQDEAAQHYGTALVPILADREAAVTAASELLFPNTRKMSGKSFDGHGWRAGRAAADRANLGAGKALDAR